MIFVWVVALDTFVVIFTDTSHLTTDISHCLSLTHSLYIYYNSGQRTSKRLKDRGGHLGRIIQCKPSNTSAAAAAAAAAVTTTSSSNTTATATTYDVDWVLGGQSKNLLRHELIWTNAEQEGMTNAYTTTSRTKRKPMDYMTETIQKDQIKLQQKQQQARSRARTPTPTVGKKRKLTSATSRPISEDDMVVDTFASLITTTDTTSTPSSSSSSTAPPPQQQPRGKPVAQKGKRPWKDGERPGTTTTTKHPNHNKSNPTTTTTKTQKSSRSTTTTSSSSSKGNAAAASGGNNHNHSTNKKGSSTSSSSKSTLTKSVHSTTGHATTSNSVATTTNTVSDISTTATLLLTATSSSYSNFDTYEKHRREFERMFLRLKTKIDYFHHFWNDHQSSSHMMLSDDKHVGMVDTVVTVTPEVNNITNDNGHSPPHDHPNTSTVAIVDDRASPIVIHTQTTTDNTTFTTDATPNTQLPKTITPPPPPILNWETIQQHMDEGRYILDRVRKEEIERQQLFGDSFSEFDSKKKKEEQENPINSTQRVSNPKGVHWELFRSDVFAMCDTVLDLLRRNHQPDDTNMDENGNSAIPNDDVDDGQKGSVSYSVRKIKEAVQIAVERTGRRHESEMKFADDRYKYTRAIESYHNTEPAMQSWRKTPYPERIYERLNSDVVCAGLSKVDEKIAAYELKTNLPNSFIGQSYRYDDTGQSEAWMKSVVDETGYQAASKKSSKRRASNASSNNSSAGDDTQKAEQERLAALALSADEGVTRAQVSATMQSLLIAVQDRVMTERNVLKQPELRSANWFATDATNNHMTTNMNNNSNKCSSDITGRDEVSSDLLPEIIEQPVWGIDCYTRRNIMCCLGTEFDTETSLLFIEKWLLPSINACPENLGHNITNAARILEGLPLDEPIINDGDGDLAEAVASPSTSPKKETITRWSESLLGRALLHKISGAGPLWLKAAANQLRCACESLGPDFFRVHPKGNGSVVLSASLKPNALVTFYRGELYPSWRWGEKMDAIEITQSRKDLKPYVTVVALLTAAF